MKTAVQSLLWFVLTASLVRADGGVEQELRALEASRTKAIHSGDRATLERLYSGDFQGVTSAGQVVDKARILEVLQGAANGPAAEIQEVQVRIFGETAVVTGLIHLPTYSFRYTHIYVQREGRWQLTAGQSTNVPR